MAVNDRERVYEQLVKEFADSSATIHAQITSLHRALDASERQREANAAAFSDVIVTQALRRIMQSQDVKSSSSSPPSTPALFGILVPESCTDTWPATLLGQVDIMRNCKVTMIFRSDDNSYSHKYDDWEFDDYDDDDTASHVIVREGTNDYDVTETRYEWRNIIMPWTFWKNAGQYWMQNWPGDCRVEEEYNQRQQRVNILTITTRRLVLVLPRGRSAPGPPDAR